MKLAVIALAGLSGFLFLACFLFYKVAKIAHFEGFKEGCTETMKEVVRQLREQYPDKKSKTGLKN